MSVDSGPAVGEKAGVVAGSGGTKGDGVANLDGGTTRQRGRRVLGRDDVGLDRLFRGIGGKGRGHDALVKGSLRAVTVVATDAEENGAFFAHRVVTIGIGSDAVVVGGEAPRSGITASKSPVVGLALDDGGEEAVGDGGIVDVLFDVDTGEEAVFQIGH